MPDNVGFVMGKVARERVLLKAFQFFLPVVIHNAYYITVTLLPLEVNLNHVKLAINSQNTLNFFQCERLI